MSFRFLFALMVSIGAIVVSSTAHAENWPSWRGPRGDGSSSDINVPTEWDASTGKNIVWQVDVPGSGHSSPIIWNGRIYLTTCMEESTERVLLCLDAESGSLIWKKTVFQGILETIHPRNSRASGTPATDGQSIFVAFMRTDGKMIPAPNVGTARDITTGEMIVAAYDLDGNQKWLVKPGDFVCAHGFSSCPVIYKDLVIVNGDHDGDSYVVALDKKTGSERWRYKREYGIRSYVTPIIREIAGRTQMVLSGSDRIISLDPNDGTLHWKIEGPTDQAVASMVYDGKLFFMTCGFPEYFVMGVRPDGSGDVTETSVAWQTTEARCYVPSPVVLNGYLLVADDRGTANCFDTATGKRHWQARLGRGFSTALIHANNLVYCIAEDGETIVVRPGKEPEIVSKNPLGQYVSASPAISNGRLYIRGEESLFCIGTPPIKNKTAAVEGQGSLSANLIGYTTFQTDLTGGRWRNVATMRARLGRIGDARPMEIGEELVDQANVWTQFAGWSTDGKTAIVNRGWNDPENGQWEEANRRFRMAPGKWQLDSYLVDIASRRATNVTAVERVSHYNSVFFLPDGNRLGMTSLIDGISKPFAMDIDGRNKTDLSGGTNGFTYGFNVSPNGKWICYHEDYQVYIALADGSQQQRVETGNPFNFSPRWSPDGQWLLFVSGQHHQSDPYVVRRDGTDLQKLADLNGYEGFVLFLDVPDYHQGSSDVPAWGAKGRWIYFAHKANHGGSEIVRCDLHGTLEQLTNTKPGVLNFQPIPSPDGQSICFGSNRSGTRQLYVMSADGGAVQPLTKVAKGHGALWPHWQPKP